MKNYNRIMSILLVLVMLLTFVPKHAIAETYGSYEDFNYEIITKNGIEQIAITEYTGKGKTEITVPEEIGGLAVTTIGSYAFGFNEAIQTVILPSITNIESEAFFFCSAMQSVSMPKVTAIESSAFYGCHKLAKVDFPLISSLGDNAFTGCSSLNKFTVAESNKSFASENGVLYNKGITTIIAFPCATGDVTLTNEITEIGISAFAETSVTSVTMPAVIRIGDSAFNMCDKLQSVKIPLVEAIDEHAFAGTALNHIDMPSVKTVAEAAFSFSSLLNEVSAPKVESVGLYAFTGTPWFENQTDKWIIIGDGVLLKYNGTDSNVTVPNNVKRIEAAFGGNEYMTSVNTANATMIGKDAFVSCYNLTSVSMPNVKQIDGNPFIDSISIKEFVVETENGFYAENGILYGKDKTLVIACPSANGVVSIPNSVIEIGRDAFNFCQRITYVDAPSVKILGEKAFSDCVLLKEINMPMLETINKDAFTFCSLLEICTIPAVTSVGENCFLGCYVLASVYLPNAKTIAKGAFSSCSELKLISIPVAESIGETAFENCTALEEVYLYCTKSIATSAFSYCVSLANVYFLCDAPSDFGISIFLECAENFTLHYASGKTGFAAQTWRGMTTEEFALENIYTVTFIDGLTLNIICEAAVKSGKDVYMIAPPKHEGYMFTGFDNDGKNITKDMEIRVLYKELTLEMGDANGDGVVNTGDATTILKAAIGAYTYTAEQEVVADMNGDGKVDTGDAVAVLRYAVEH